MTLEELTVQDLQVRAVNVPMSLPLVTGGGAVSAAPLALIDLRTKEGVTGCAYVFCYSMLTLAPAVRLLENLSDVLMAEGQALLAAVAQEERRG